MFKNLLKEYQEGYVYLFSDRSFYKKLWIIPFLLFFPFIKYPFGIIFIKGWQVQMVEDIMLDKPLQSLQIKKIVLKGLQITGVTIIYWMVPTAFCYLLGLKGILGLFLDILEFIQGGLTGYLTDYIEDYIVTLFIYFIWGMISNPILQCGIIRYALTGKWLELLNIPKNILFLMANLHNFLKFYVFYLVTVLLLIILDSLLLFIAFPIEILLLPFLLVLYYGSVSHELGHLAKNAFLKQVNSKKDLTADNPTDYIENTHSH